MNNNIAVFGLMRGDEGKGKIVDYFTKDTDMVIRYAGGPNAGHTIYRGDEKIVLHQIPSGILEKKICLIGRGCVVDLKKLISEIKQVEAYFKSINELNFNICDYLKLSLFAHIIKPSDIFEDIQREDSGKGNGSTKCGIAPAYRDKYYRSGLRVWDLISNEKYMNDSYALSDEDLQLIRNIIIDDEVYLNRTTKYNKKLFEGAQGILLDIDSPYYPNVSSSSPGIGGILTGTGISYQQIKKNFEAIGVAKIYMSSVGDGKFLTEINDNYAQAIREAGKEYGATTGRPRKIGWLDIPLLNYAIETSGVDSVCLTRLDTLRDAILSMPKNERKFKVCYGYKNINDNEVLYRTAPLFNVLNNYNEWEPLYKEFEIWESNLFTDVKFIEFINWLKTHIFAPIQYISIGKNKNDILKIF